MKSKKQRLETFTIPLGKENITLTTPKNENAFMLIHEHKLRLYDTKYSNEMMNLTYTEQGIAVNLEGPPEGLVIKFAYNEPHVAIVGGLLNE
ncbi:hypothetical protein [Bacillus sp. 1P06AnD]|uniref:hypothetical protein n=1 Tax=Bacillus sp. 1P06AnD TaxID=3132208 RepID=UPI0039A008B8